MRSARLFAVLMLLYFAVPSLALAQWTNEPAGSTAIADCPFPLSGCPGWYDGYGTPYASDPSDPQSPPTVADFALNYIGPCPANVGVYQPCAVGGGQFGYYHNAASRELYVGQWMKLSAGYGCSAVGLSKTFFMRSFDLTFGGPRINGVFLVAGCGPSKTFVFSHNTGDQPGYPALHNEHACPEDASNGLTCRQNINPVAFQTGQMVKVESCMRASTTMTSRDGVLRLWVNGVEVMRYTNLNYGQGVINQADWTPTWDGHGNGQGFTTTVHQYYAHVRISIPPSNSFCGLGGGSSPPPPTPTPPPPPPPSGNPGTVSDLSVTALSSTSLQVQFTAVDDGTGSPAQYDVRVAPAPINWGAASSVVNGTCATTYGPGLIAQLVTCTIAGLNPGTPYQVQTVAFRGTINVNAVYGSLSNVGSASTPSIPAPIISGFTPSSGLEGSAVIISGTGFDAVAGNNTVKLNGQTATVTAASSTSLTVTVPSGATTGRISVQTNAGTGFSDFNFTVNVVNSPVIPDGCGCS